MNTVFDFNFSFFQALFLSVSLIFFLIRWQCIVSFVNKFQFIFTSIHINLIIHEVLIAIFVIFFIARIDSLVQKSD